MEHKADAPKVEDKTKKVSSNTAQQDVLLNVVQDLSPAPTEAKYD